MTFRRDATDYRKRARAWRDKAFSLFGERPERALCFQLADGYEKLAIQLEELATQRPIILHHPPGDLCP